MTVKTYSPLVDLDGQAGGFFLAAKVRAFRAERDEVITAPRAVADLKIG